MFAQMATTAAGVAVGSAVGHTMANAVSGLFGGSSEAPAQQQQQQAPLQQQAAMDYGQPLAGSCDLVAKDFTRCLEATGNDMQTCNHYFKMLQACQSGSSSSSSF
ncbi:hypothetical protein LPJ61_002585 [Coemansia biformis]|uniref:CHCH domain-containing protein n=1 Tax=Coemansia biformis TaxID=1286918 RepID=A0A9W8CZ20_9FUNG|nr:hypothetical protein LPJ61_002585 [Coemansia biformis]